jgi:NAD-dependent SIR2 family protein deacetylase
MGVDSGLPDFRGDRGFWNAYPAYEKLGVKFIGMANPDHFRHDPELGWGFYGHRRNLYRATEPHAGFAALLEFGTTLPGGYFSFTSNVDGHFARAGFDRERIIECHGAIDYLQCLHECRGRVWPADDRDVPIDESTMRTLAEALPRCPDCEGIARPNILMFGDWGWNSLRFDGQEQRYRDWLGSIAGSKLVILEFGAGTAVPTVRLQSERIAASLSNATLIRVNPREPEIAGAGVSISSGALEAIGQILL